jgi:LacI family transcriptional regulator
MIPAAISDPGADEPKWQGDGRRQSHRVERAPLGEGEKGEGVSSPRRRPTRLTEIADRASVSLATASRALNGSDRAVSERLRRRVLTAAAELGYAANPHAQAMARGASNVVGLVVQDLADPYFSTIADGVMRQCERRGLVTVLASTRRDPGREIECVVALRAQQAQAIIIVGSRTNDRELTARVAKELAGYVESGGRAACVSQYRLGTNTVLVQNRSGARDLARELAQLGHRRFAVLAGPTALLTARDRHAGFVDGLARDGGYVAAQQLIAGGLDVTCVFACNDVMAVGAIAAFRDSGLRVPQDVSVAGFDDLTPLRDFVPQLTSVHLDLEDLGERVAALALDRNPEDRPQLVRVRGRVVLRGSTRGLP